MNTSQLPANRRAGTCNQAGARAAPPSPHANSPVQFLVLTLALSLPFWVAGSIVTTGVLPAGLPITLFQFICPLLAAGYLTYRRQGAAGIRRLLQRTWSPHGLRVRWLPAVLLVPAGGLLTYALLPLAGIARDGAHQPLSAGLGMLIIGLLTASAEETGWMGYAFYPLQARWGSLRAGLILGAVWAAWHLPAMLQAHRPTLWIAGWALGTIAGRVLIVGLFTRAGGVVLMAVFLHALMIANDAMIPHHDLQPRPAAAIISGLCLAAAAATVMLTRSQRTSAMP